MRYHVLGIGAIGTLVAHHLRLSQPSPQKVCLVVRHADTFRQRARQHAQLDLTSSPSPQLDPASSHPQPFPGPTLRVTRVGGAAGSPSVATSDGYEIDVSDPRKVPGLVAALADGSVSTVHTAGPIDSLIVCTKTSATARAIEGLFPRLSPNSVIALLQNGMGVYDELCAKFWPDPETRPQFVLGTTTHGVTPTSTPGSVLHQSRPGEGVVKWGVVPDPRGEVDYEQWLWGRQVGKLPALAPPESPTLPLPPPPAGSSIGITNMAATLGALLSLAPLSPTLLPMPHLYHELLLKLAMNATINPLTAVLGGGYLTNGVLHRSGPGHRLVEMSVTETSAILTAYLHNLSSPHPASPDSVRLFSRQSLLARVHALIVATRDNFSSMAGDVKHGRETEIDYINGFLISLGRRLHLDTPVHRMLQQMVKFKAEIGGLNKEIRLTPAVDRRMREGESGAMEERRLALEERKLALDERAMLLKEGRIKEVTLARRKAARAAKKARAAAKLHQAEQQQEQQQEQSAGAAESAA